MASKAHWEQVYAGKAVNQVSWFQAHPEYSLRLIHATGLDRDAAIIDVGGGASTLVDDLLADGYRDLTVLDLSGTALASARARLGEPAAAVHWIEADITQIELPDRRYDLWHDRAVFHFLTEAREREVYVRTVLRAVKPGGHVIVASFAEDGPERCSGLPIVRYRPDSLHAEFGDAFTLLRHETEAHQTPAGKVQQFVYCYCRKTAAPMTPPPFRD